MKSISLTLGELEIGEKLTRLGPKRLAEFIDACTIKQPMNCNPLPREGRTTNVIVLKKVESSIGLKHRIKFASVWGRAFKLIGTDGALRLLTIETDKGQVSFDRAGKSITTFRLDGPGVDPEQCDPEQDFRKIINQTDEPIVQHLRRYLSEEFGSKP